MQYVLNLKALKYITVDIFWYIMLWFNRSAMKLESWTFHGRPNSPESLP